jgi:ATP-binding cassette subfamily F protein 3
VISVDNLWKGYASQVLFEGISFKINPKERVGLVGRNGHGKTTLLRLITGEEEPDSGAVVIPKNYRIGYVTQQLDFTEPTVLEEGMKGLGLKRQDQAWRVEKVLAGLGFSESDMHRNPSEFSGGFQVRLNLAKVLVSDPDMLLLDEPTNYLDITSIRWIERFLSAWPRELILITHDRTFMDRIVTHTMGIHRRKVRKVEGGTAKYYAQIAQDEEVYERTRANEERRRKEVEEFIAQFRAKARLVGLVQSRIKLLEKMERKERLEKIETLEFSFRNTPFYGKYVLSANDLCFSYDGAHPVISGFDMVVRPGDKVCIVGPNGRGKTTLLKLLAGRLRPRRGEVVMHPKVSFGVYEQTSTSTLVPTRTVEEEIMSAAPDIDRQRARGICGAMMFEGSAALKRIEVLSGGEKSRVMLGKLLAQPLNLLLLDEPSNHLDMESTDALLAALDSFEGAIVMVTHNEMLLHALAQRLVVFRNGGMEIFEGGYGWFLRKGGWADEEDAAPVRKDAGPAPEVSRPGRKELRRRRGEIINERSRVIGPIEKRMSLVESEIERLEKELGGLQGALELASLAKDGRKVVEVSGRILECEKAIDAFFSELDSLHRQREDHRAAFEEQLARLGD